MNKRILSLVLTLVLIFTLTSQAVSALTVPTYKGSSSACIGQYDTYGSGVGPYNTSYYNQLDAEQKNIYNKIVGLPKTSTVISVTLLNPIRFTSRTSYPTNNETAGMMTQLGYIVQPAMDAFLRDNPIVFWIDLNGGTTFSVEYDGVYSGGKYYWTVSAVDINIEVDSKYLPDTSGFVNRANSKIANFSTSKTDRYDILKDIHDYLCRTVVYDLNATYSHEPYGALVTGKAVCEGYAEAFMLLCQKYNIPCACIVGMGVIGTDSEPHMWNYVQMENGKWYAVDVTWDDQGSTVYDYFLTGSQTVADSKAFYNSHVEDPSFSLGTDFSFVYPVLSTSAYVYDPCGSGHTLSDWIVTLQPTYTSEGQRVKKCTVCGDIIITEAIPKLVENATDAVVKPDSFLSLSGEYLLGARAEMTVSDISAQFDGKITVTSSSGASLSATSIIGTGCVVNTGTKIYKIVVKGDVDGNGKITSIDFLLIKRSFLNTITLNAVQLKAACISGGPKPISADFLKVKRHFLRTYDLYA